MRPTRRKSKKADPTRRWGVSKGVREDEKSGMMRWRNPMRGEAPCAVSRRHSERERLEGSIWDSPHTRPNSPRVTTEVHAKGRFASRRRLPRRPRPSIPDGGPDGGVLSAFDARHEPRRSQITGGGRGIAPLERRMCDGVGSARSAGKSTNSGPVVGRSLVEGTGGGPGLA